MTKLVRTRNLSAVRAAEIQYKCEIRRLTGKYTNMWGQMKIAKGNAIQFVGSTNKGSCHGAQQQG